MWQPEGFDICLHYTNNEANYNTWGHLHPVFETHQQAKLFNYNAKEFFEHVKALESTKENVAIKKRMNKRLNWKTEYPSLVVEERILENRRRELERMKTAKDQNQTPSANQK